MKKIFTLLVGVGSITFASAQYHNSDNVYSQNNGHTYSGRSYDRRFDNSYSFSARERDEQIAKVNFEFEAKLRDLNADRFLRPNKRRKEVARLDFERSQQIRDINARFSDKRNRFSSAYAYGNNARRY